MKNSKPLHILIANNVYPPIMAGGAELIVQYLAEGLAWRGHRVTVVSTCGPDMEPYPCEYKNGVEVIRFFPRNLYWHWTRGDRPGYQKALWHMRDAWNTHAGQRFQAILKESRPDVLHSHLIDGLSAALWGRARQHGIPVVHTAHDYHLLCPRSLMMTRALKPCVNPRLSCQVYRKWHLRTTRNVTVFCSPSQFLIDRHREAGLAVKRTAVVRNGIPLPSPANAAPKDNTVRRFLFMARLTMEKGCQVVLDAMKLMPQDMKFELCVAGKGVFEEAFREAARQDPRIRMLGYIQGSAKEQVFRQADCLLLPSLWYENAPVVIIEASAYGMGVIGSNIGAIPEFIDDGKNGLLFKPGCAQSLAAAMQRFIREEELGKRFQSNSRRLAEGAGIEQMVDAYLGQYTQLLAA